MNTFPSPHNPENLPPAAPGYRYLGKEEAINTEHDELWHANRWVNVNRACLWPSQHNPDYTYRRPINVDDPSAPPPEEWEKPGYEVTGPFIDRYPMSGEEYWATGSKVWYPATHPSGAPLMGRWYYRRPLPVNITPSTQPSMTTSTPSKVVLKTRRAIGSSGYQEAVLSSAIDKLAESIKAAPKWGEIKA